MRVMTGLALTMTLALPRVSEAQLLITKHDVVVASSVLGAALATSLLDARVSHALQRSALQDNASLRSAADAGNMLGSVGVIGLGAAMAAGGHVTGQSTLQRTGMETIEAIGAGGAAGFLMKGLVGRSRPFATQLDPDLYHFGGGFTHGQYASFPSGHTIAAFATASVIVHERELSTTSFPWRTAALSYGAATFVGFSRMYSNQHWASDVLMGAAVGTLSGLKVVGWNHARMERHAMQEHVASNVLLHMTIAPTSDVHGRGALIGFSW